MKIDVVGCTCTWFRGLNTSYIINDEILFDIPQGSFKSLLLDYDLSKIKYIIISHFHSDHFMDFHLVIDYFYKHFPNKKITVISPKGCYDRLIATFNILEVKHLKKPLDDNYIFIECKNNKIINLESYKIKTFKMLHEALDSYGFIIENEGVKVGFSGDSAMCNNVRKILSKSCAVFIDGASIEKNNKHLSANEVDELRKDFPECKLYPIHLTPFSREKLVTLNFHCPIEGEVFEIK